LFNYYLKTKGFYFRTIINQFKKFSHIILQIGQTYFFKKYRKISFKNDAVLAALRKYP